MISTCLLHLHLFQTFLTPLPPHVTVREVSNLLPSPMLLNESLDSSSPKSNFTLTHANILTAHGKNICAQKY